MQRATIMLPPKLKVRAQRRAKERGVSFSTLVQESLETVLEPAEDDPRRSDSLFADDAVFIGDAPSDLSRNHDRYLYEDSNVQ